MINFLTVGVRVSRPITERDTVIWSVTWRFNKKYALLFSTLCAYWTQLAAAVIPRLLWTAFRFAQPFLINTKIK